MFMLSFYLTCFVLLILVVFVSVIYSCVKVSLAGTGTPPASLSPSSLPSQPTDGPSQQPNGPTRGQGDAGSQLLVGPGRRLDREGGRSLEPCLY